MGNFVSQLVGNSNKTFIAFLKREADDALFDYQNLVFVPNQKLHLTLDSATRSRFRIPYVEQSPGSYRFSLDCSAFADGYYTVDSREIVLDAEFPSIDIASYKIASGSVVENSLDIGIQYSQRKSIFCYIKRNYDGRYYKPSGDFDQLDVLGDSEEYRSNFRVAFTESPPGSYSVSRSLDSFLDGVYTVTIYLLTSDMLEIKAGMPITIHVLNKRLDRGVLYNKVNLTHDTGTNDALRYIAPNGDPISGATIQVHDANLLASESANSIVGITTTSPDGRWVSPVTVEAGKSYTIILSLPGKYGPDKITLAI
jgi:hypothetical protein